MKGGLCACLLASVPSAARAMEPSGPLPDHNCEGIAAWVGKAEAAGSEPYRLVLEWERDVVDENGDLLIPFFATMTRPEEASEQVDGTYHWIAQQTHYRSMRSYAAGVAECFDAATVDQGRRTTALALVGRSSLVIGWEAYPDEQHLEHGDGAVTLTYVPPSLPAQTRATP